MYMSRYTPYDYGASPPVMDGSMQYSPGVQMPWGNMDAITFDSQDIDIGALGLEPDLMGPWLEYIPNDVLGLFGDLDR